MPTLNNSQTNGVVGQAFSYTPTFTPSNILQGLGCGGDDGTIGYSPLPAGLTAAPDGTITGTPLIAGYFTVSVEIIGTNEDCSAQVIAYTFPLVINITVPPTWWSKNFIFKNLTHPLAKGRAQASILVNEFFDSPDYVLLTTTEAYADSLGNVRFYLDSAIDSLLEADKRKGIVPPTDGQQQYIIRKFKLQVVMFDSVGDALEEYETDPETVLLGGIDYKAYRHFDMQTHLDRFPFFQEMHNLGGWLSYSGELTISPSQPEYLFMFSVTAGYRVRAYRANGTFVETLDNVVGLRCIDIRSFILPDTVRITVVAMRLGLPFGPAKSYVIDREDRLYERFLMFRNSKGAIETIRCTGELSEEVEQPERIVSERILLPEYQMIDGESFVWKTSRDLKISKSLCTGWISVDYYKYLASELLNSTEVYEVSGDGTLLPILITTKKLEAFRDKEFMRGLEIDYTYAF